MKFSPSTNQQHLAAIIKQIPSGFILKSDSEMLQGLKALPEDVDFNQADGDFNTVLYLAAANNCSDTIDYLLEVRKVDPNITVSDGLTAAHIAAMTGNLKALQALMKSEQIELSIQDDFGETPLFRALGNLAEAKGMDIVSLLIEKDQTAVLIPNEDNTDPLELALQGKRPGYVEILLDNGAQVSERCRDMSVAMMLERSKPSPHFGGANVLFTGDIENANLRACAKLITEAYDKQQKGAKP
ncbi:Ankyrin repeat protein [Legionella shakespearei DSM 23087]|uniref:Ankyrin repeat protein n=2 Tax=Legionella shakespearei TaxID=45075 RepID=A0A0W0YVT0_9GAMM|nr:Ankyrin repeat protein [Legionella shakespearei DSM 23087]